MKFLILYLIVCVVTLISCTKKTEQKEPPPPPEPAWTPYTVPPQPELKLTRLIERRPRAGGGADTYTIEFTYDDKNRLNIARGLEDDNIIAEYHYNGEELSKEVVYDGTRSEFDTCVRFSRNFDTVDFTYPNAVVITRGRYIFRDSLLSRFENAYKFVDEDWKTSSYYVWAYSPEKNLQQLTAFASPSPSIVKGRVLATDTRKNPLRHLTIFLLRIVDLEGTFISGMGVNNATRIESAPGQILDIQYTYNNEGYPVTMTFPNGRVVELEYSR